MNNRQDSVMSERDEKNRKIAEWIEPLSSLPNEDDSEEMRAYESAAWIATFRLSKVTGMHVPAWEPQDFYTSEEASALVLEKMLQPCVFRCAPGGQWACCWNMAGQADEIAIAVDRKTAIAEAALKRIEVDTKK